MRKLSQMEFREILENRDSKKRLVLKDIELFDMDFTSWDLSDIDFSLSTFHRIKFDGANLENSSVSGVLFDECTVRNTNFKNADLEGATLRYVDMTGCNIKGANLHAALLEYAKLDGVVSDKDTKWFRLHCPEKGAFIGYKKCFNNRLVQLLIPADAKRTSATLPSCRCNKAKVLTIKSFDYKESYKEAWSLVDENFVYRAGEWVEVKDFNEDRWMDSTTGIHFWMTIEEAKNY
ncbi:pentapeptide repeat-containing protein [Clostridium fermenticellae]|uniref:Pentapeptide repeat-containing protein n=1 Tax=Clostridium fermenticellae TaxID=2068654 RepID=A0A386H5C7_9CLOT|nr:pentapeptide repeat-containing protein [Clostridium fermenticellae]AYD40912.1 pentapeptide repeat-containing protein [Clostridium fermenticellae]